LANQTTNFQGDPGPPLRLALLELELADLRIDSRNLAAGYQLGHHLANKKGPGIEFLGHRAYSPGDDLRHLDRRAFLRHRRYLLREFHVETDRPVHLMVDVSPSMEFADPPEKVLGGGRKTRTKSGLARLLGAALALIAGRQGDPVGLSLLGNAPGKSRLPSYLPARGGSEQLERILVQLETVPRPDDGPREPMREVLLETTSRVPPRATVIWISDFLDTLPDYESNFTAIGATGRTLKAVQILTQTESTFPFQGPMVFVNPETGERTETDAVRARDDYLRALGDHNLALDRLLGGIGAVLLRTTTDADPRELLGKVKNQPSGGRSA
jgi:uncharacterized protein (DUF58 family)